MQSQGLISDAFSIKGISRQHNQDRFLLNTGFFEHIPIGLFIVADGMGGLSEGARASQTLIYGLEKWWQDELKVLLFNYDFNDNTFKESLDACLVRINDSIRQYGEGHQIQMGTTLVGMFVWGQNALLFNIGDSRAYRIAKGQISQITIDHSWVSEQVAKGLITPEEAQTHPKRNLITRCIGMTPLIDVNYSHHLLNKEEIYIFCSDGFYSQVVDRDIQKILKSKGLSRSKLYKSMKNLSELLLKTTHSDDATVAVIIC